MKKQDLLIKLYMVKFGSESTPNLLSKEQKQLLLSLFPENESSIVWAREVTQQLLTETYKGKIWRQIGETDPYKPNWSFILRSTLVITAFIATLALFTSAFVAIGIFDQIGYKETFATFYPTTENWRFIHTGSYLPIFGNVLLWAAVAVASIAVISFLNYLAIDAYEHYISKSHKFAKTMQEIQTLVQTLEVVNQDEVVSKFVDLAETDSAELKNKISDLAKKIDEAVQTKARLDEVSAQRDISLASRLEFFKSYKSSFLEKLPHHIASLEAEKRKAEAQLLFIYEAAGVNPLVQDDNSLTKTVQLPL
jgi:hypothetical protein